MIKLGQIRSFMSQLADEDRKLKAIEVNGDSLEEALQQASGTLGVPVKALEYEVLTQGAKGGLGVGKKNWVLRVYKSLEVVKQVTNSEDKFVDGIDLEEVAMVEKKRDLPGEVFVRLRPEGVFLKVTKPKGKGSRATEKMAMDAIQARNITNFNAALVAKVVRNADSQYIHIGTFEYNPVNDAIMNINITDGEMKVFVEVRQPGMFGADLGYENMVAILNNNGVVFGIKEDVLRHFEDYPEYGTSILAAEGVKPVYGSDAKIVYNFKTDRSNLVLKEKDGKVDFKDLNLVENVVAGQFLAKKIPAEEGIAGQTTTGQMLPTKSGKDTVINIGKNVKLSEDGLTAISEINGQVILLNKKINVEPVYTVNGDVNLHTGNILFLGTVMIKGNVDDGFSVKASGNIEVMGNVGKCEIDAEGDIIVHQGILGKNGGKVRCGGNVFAKFIEHSHIDAIQNVVASEGIIHSFVDSNLKVVCQGRRASIVGGRIRAAEEINAKNLGSIAGSETILEAGYDPKSKEQMVALDNQVAAKMKDLEEIERNLKTLLNLKKVQKKFPEDKEKSLKELQEKRMGLLGEIEDAKKKVEEIKYRLASIKKQGKVSASDKVFPGVKIFIKDVGLEVRNEFKRVTFILDRHMIMTTKYEPIEEEIKRRY